jgi:hypothetical protein
VPLKKNVDAALAKGEVSLPVLVVKRTGASVAWDTSKDFW